MTNANLTHIDLADADLTSNKRVWDTELAFKHLQACGQANTRQCAEYRLSELGLQSRVLTQDDLQDEQGHAPNRLVLEWAISQAYKREDLVLFAQLNPLLNGKPCLHANDARGARFWLPLCGVDVQTIRQALVERTHLPTGLPPYSAIELKPEHLSAARHERRPFAALAAPQAT
ncbi:MAG: nodP [Solimicrobium sp.]|nr:nodP [Solimicrobium sp.]